MMRHEDNVLDSNSPRAPSHRSPRRRVLRWGLLVCGIVLIAVVVMTMIAMRRNITRYYAFAGYFNAVSYCCPQGEPMPMDIREIEDAYNNWDRHRVVLPSPPYFLRPTFRPVESWEGGPYIVFIETKPSGLHLPTRYVFFAGGDRNGQTCWIDSVWEWELDELIREDDKRRRAAEDPTQ